ncbi:hypothetical protein C8J57DRAFT_1255995 [Mycena rebaudengoi]|nr:hypothetical protein C8J57DRAFT_1255995 [Mycena rebaudengoi]
MGPRVPDPIVYADVRSQPEKTKIDRRSKFLKRKGPKNSLKSSAAAKRQKVNEELTALLSGFAEVDSLGSRKSLEDAQNDLRRLLNGRSPVDFPYGAVYVGVDQLVSILLGNNTYAEAVVECELCGYIVPGHVVTLTPMLVVGQDVESDNPVMGISTWLSRHFSKHVQNCPLCNARGIAVQDSRMMRMSKILSIPPLLCLSLESRFILLEREISLQCQGIEYSLELRGLVYHSESHFTARVIRPDGGIWFQDGIVMQQAMVWDGMLGLDVAIETLRMRGSRTAVVALCITLRIVRILRRNGCQV